MGKSTVDNPPSSTYCFNKYNMQDIMLIQDMLRDIGKASGKSMVAVSLNYNTNKAAVLFH